MIERYQRKQQIMQGEKVSYIDVWEREHEKETPERENKDVLKGNHMRKENLLEDRSNEIVKEQR